MINQLEIPMFLEDALPELSGTLNLDKNKNAYSSIGVLTKFTQEKVSAHDYNAVKRCFSLADTLYEKGNNAVKAAVENVFVFSFTNIFQGDSSCVLRSIVPMTLYSLYISQVYHRGC